MEIFVVRHGETICDGQNEPETPLSASGIEQAKKVGEYLKKLKSFDAVYASPLLRTKQTAQFITNNEVHIIYDERLKEGDHGNLELEKNKEKFDVLRAEYRQKYPDPVDYEEHFEEFNAILSKEYTFETTAQFAQRVTNFFQFLRTQNHKRVLIITHSGFMSTALCNLFRIKLSNAARKTITHCCIFGMRETYDSYTMTTPWFNV